MIPLGQEGPDPAVLAQVGAVLATTSLAITPLAIAVVRRIFPGRNVVFARWGFSHVAQIVLIAAVLLAAVALVRTPRAEPSAGLERDQGTLFDLALTAGILLSCCGAVALFAIRLDPSGPRCLGLWPGRQIRAALAGLAGYGMLLPGILGLGMLWPWVLRAAGAQFEPQLVVEKMRDLAPGDRPVAILLGVAILPLFEEILFRAFLQPLLVQNLSDRLGIIATSLVFAALHGTGAFLPIFALSLLLGAIMLRTQRLLAVWSVHALHNGLMFLFLYAMPQTAGGAPAPGWLPFT